MELKTHLKAMNKNFFADFILLDERIRVSVAANHKHHLTCDVTKLGILDNLFPVAWPSERTGKYPKF